MFGRGRPVVSPLRTHAVDFRNRSGHLDHGVCLVWHELLLSAGGLAAMMVLGVLVRLRIRDPLVAAIPAFACFVLTLYIVVAAL